MESEYCLTRDGPVAGTEIEALRAAVGWDTMENEYERILPRVYARYTIRADECLIAYMHVISDGIADAFLLDLMVHPDFQRQGIGKALVQQAIADLTADGIRAIQVTFDSRLEGFYRKCGFHIFGGGIIDNGPRRER